MASAAAHRLPPAAHFVLSKNRAFRSEELPTAAEGRKVVIKTIKKGRHLSSL